MTIDLTLAAAPLIVAVGAVLVLLLGLWFPARVAETTLGVLAIAGVALALTDSPARTFCLNDGCSYVLTRQALILQWLVLAAAAGVVLLAARYVEVAGIARPEFFALLLASVSGALVVPASGDLATLVIAVETVSLPVYALIGLRRDDPRGGEAALKAFLVSVAATAITLYGVALLYGLTGTVWLAQLPAALRAAPQGDAPGAALLNVAVILILATFAFKATAVPLQAWAPDAYAGAPLPVTAYLAVVSKTAGIAGILLLVRAMAPEADVWGPVLAAVAIASLIVGVFGALRQDTGARLMAWSSVAQAGFLLAPLGAVAMQADRLDSATAAVIAYLVTYVAMTLAVFAALVAVSAGRRGDVPRADLTGLARTAPVPAAVLTLGLVSLAGLPPVFLGLFAKVRVIAEPVGAGAWWLAAALALAVLVGAAVYLRWLVPVFAPAPERAVRPVVPAGILVAGVAAAVVLVVGSVAPELVLGLL